MEDKRVSELPIAESIGDADLFVMEQGGEAKSVTGEKIKGLYGGKEIDKITIASSGTTTYINYLFKESGQSLEAMKFNEYGYPVSIERDGEVIDVEWMVDDA